ncbi:MAG: Ig-like domain-containing protein, partial [Bacteroidales bacterium]|nr:Ig-like domain-containing protein [Bacteroidales bacterium]
MRSFRNLLIRVPVCLLCLQLVSCASIGSPSGGPKDEAPPVLLKTLPENNSRNYTKKKLEIYFDELISVENASERVIVSPPQKTAPQVNAVMKKIVVELQDSLKANETYTIDFTNSIVDLNEKNPYGDYAFAFSTGSDIDTLRVSGIVLRASNLNPERNILVGAHLDLNDSAFIKEPFLRISKTDAQGRFCIKNLKPGPYKIYALDDKNRDYRFDQPGEALAFPDSTVSLWTEICQRYDTTWIDSLTIDTIRLVDYICYKPDDILLKLYEEDFGRQYLVKSERASKEYFSLIFGYKADSLPRIKLLSPGPGDIGAQTDSTDWFFCEKNPTNDSLVYWIKDSSIYRCDTLHIQLDYLKTDSNNILSAVRDTLRLFTRKPAIASGRNLSDRERSRRDKRDQDSVIQSPPIDHLKLETNIKPTLDIYSTLYFTWESP